MYWAFTFYCILHVQSLFRDEYRNIEYWAVACPGGDRGGKPPPLRNFLGEILEINDKKLRQSL